MKNKIVIIGGVAGGATVAARLRRLSEKYEIIIFERGEYISFANCGLPYYIGGVISDRDELILQSPENFKSKFNIDVRINHEVLKINRQEQTLSVKNLITQEISEVSFDKLIISTGASPIKPPISGLDEASNVFTLRTIPDADNIKNYILENKVKDVAVIGGGFIGLEMAENLHHLGLKVTIVELGNQVMAPIDLEMAELVHQHLREKKVNLILEDGLKAFLDYGKTLELNSGLKIKTDLVLLAIGVRPENILAREAGLEAGTRGGLIVNRYLQTNDPNIYALGDVIEVTDLISQKAAMIPLAGPANKQARIVANNIFGYQEAYLGTLGTSVAKVFDLVVGATGNNEKTLKLNKANYASIHIHPSSHASYYPHPTPISMKILYNPETEFIYGAQAIGREGVDKRIDVLATAISAKMKVTDLKNIELSYAPPFSSAKDPVNLLGLIAENKIKGLVNNFPLSDFDNLDAQKIILDIREVEEFNQNAIPGAINIPLSRLRQDINLLPRDKEIYIYCETGVRSYNASRVLMQAGYNVKNLSGGFYSYRCFYKTHK